MQKEYLIETRAVTDEKGTLLNLKYYLIEEERPVSPAPLYRICIKKSLTGESRSGGGRKHAARIRFRKPGPLTAPA